jgi:hypothetical protein
MQTINPYKITVNTSFNENDLSKGIFIVILHASRIPPHIGIIAGNKYHSLSIKGQEINLPLEAFLKNIRIRKIPSIFIKIKSHPTFSNDYLKEHFIHDIQQFAKVEAGAATCLSPLRSFFEEVYSVSTTDVNFIFELLPRLESNGLIESVAFLFIAEEHFHLPVYDMDQINDGIRQANREAKQIRFNKQ